MRVEESSRPIPWVRWLLLGAYGVVLVALMLAWQDPDWQQHMSPQALSRHGAWLLAQPLGPVAVIGGYVLMVLMAVPVLALITVGTLVFGPWPGMAYSLLGMVAGATVAYGFGRFTGARGMDRFAQGRLSLLDAHLKQRGLITIALVRFMPVAPFMVVNLAAGALRVRLRDYVLGTFFGLLPGAVVLSLFLEQLKEAWRNPDASTYAVAAIWAVVTVLALWWFKRYMARRPV
ncbi:MAG: hypothetical protein A2711_09235 [Burkholderiales bacterium RIFCSPHIGHO2_01_FULL_63_240]|nr:MAG: hypothetical protein A2711_09235 [Burkholderiales bacterium RIFCSPHIGHO2_01_FULL_63_240]